LAVVEGGCLRSLSLSCGLTPFLWNEDLLSICMDRSRWWNCIRSYNTQCTTSWGKA